MRMSADGRKRLISREGKRLRAYRDTKGIWTIGTGHTSAAGPPLVTPGLVITEAENDAILSRDLVQFETAINDALDVPVTQGQFDALVSLAFNVGAHRAAESAIVHLLNEGHPVEAGNAFMQWSKPREIIGRRKTERDQFLAATPEYRHGAVSRPVAALGLLDTGEAAAEPDEVAVRGAQTRLKQLGYFPGAVDGQLGPATKGQLLTFQAEKGLPETGRLDDATTAALASQLTLPRELPASRSKATVEDLREAGSETIKAADDAKETLSLKTIGGTGLGAIAANAAGQSDQAKKLMSDWPGVLPWIVDHAALIAIVVVLAVVWWQRRAIVKALGRVEDARVEEHRSGANMGR